MSKSTRFTQQALEAMGLEPDGQGGYKKKSSLLQRAAPLQNEISNNYQKINSFLQTNSQTERLYIEPKPFNISAIRELNSGTKARKEAMDGLHKMAVDRISYATNAIYIKGNVASSKNSKEIGVYYSGKGASKKKMSTLVDSKATRAYRKETANSYSSYTDRFLQMVEGKEYPLMVKFTFIRKNIGRFDFGNAQQIVADLMVDNGWMPDDSTEYFVPVFNPTVYYSPTVCGVIIEVL